MSNDGCPMENIPFHTSNPAGTTKRNPFMFQMLAELVLQP